jgi:hypothetical protein
MSNFLTVDHVAGSQQNLQITNMLMSLVYHSNGRPRLLIWKGEVFGLAYSLDFIAWHSNILDNGK